MAAPEARGKDGASLADPGLLCGTPLACEPRQLGVTVPLTVGFQGRCGSALACPPGGPGEEGAGGRTGETQGPPGLSWAGLTWFFCHS